MIFYDNSVNNFLVKLLCKINDCNIFDLVDFYQTCVAPRNIEHSPQTEISCFQNLVWEIIFPLFSLSTLIMCHEFQIYFILYAIYKKIHGNKEYPDLICLSS